MILIVADDMGADQVAVYGGEDAPATPVLDGLAAAGVRFDQAWAATVCSPARACIQTGRFSFRTGVGNFVRPDSETPALPLSEYTLPEVLDLGTGGLYSHAAIGKWHLGNLTVGAEMAPNLAGYSYFAGTLGNLRHGDDYYAWNRVENGVEQFVTRYVTAQEVDDALAWIESVPEPWFCYLAFHAPHSPLHVPPAELGPIFVDSRDNRAMYKAMITAMDSEIGRLLEELGERRVRTTVIFVGDNGTPRGVLPPSTPEYQAKFTLYEGGVRVPLIVSADWIEQPGRTVVDSVHAVDLFATVAEIAGASLDELPPEVEIDSVSLVPYLLKLSAQPARTFNFSERFIPNGGGPEFGFLCAAVRDDRYKLIASDRYPFHDGTTFYDLWADPDEAVDLLGGPPLEPQVAQRFMTLANALRDLTGY